MVDACFVRFCRERSRSGLHSSLLVGEAGRYHHGPSHSVGCAILFGVAVSVGILFLRLGDIIRKSIIFFSLYFSHVILDISVRILRFLTACLCFGR
jgi:hypothetical protein